MPPEEFNNMPALAEALFPKLVPFLDQRYVGKDTCAEISGGLIEENNRQEVDLAELKTYQKETVNILREIFIAIILAVISGIIGWFFK